MNSMTVPKKAATLQYELVRLPATLVENQLVVRLLDDDSKFRLAYERALGSLDETAGRLLDNETLEKRGAALRRRSDVLATAVALEDKAAARKAEAEQTLQAKKKAVAQERQQANKTRQQGVQQAAQAERDEKERLGRETKAREQAEKQNVEQQAAERTEQAKHQAQADKARIAAEERADTAAPKAQFKEAGELAKTAQRRTTQAERLAKLADVEAQTRRAEREARANS